MMTEAQKRAQKKYDEANRKNWRIVNLKLNRETDADIIQKLESVDGMQTYIKKLIREETLMISQKRIMQVFDFGFEEMYLKDFNSEPAYKPQTFHRSDFETGKMKDFANYTVERFSREFAGSVTFG